MERICFQVEEAQWFYEDFIRPLDPNLPSLSLRQFCLRIFQHCPLLSGFSSYHHSTAFSEFLAYKTRVPVRGAIMLNEAMDEVVLVKGWKKGANWSFPRGKINKDEKDLDCAIREVYEETGFDIQGAGLTGKVEDAKYIEITMREQHMRLYIFKDVPVDTHFEPRTRKEISKIQWFKLSELPTLKKSKQHQQEGRGDELAVNANKFYMVAPFLVPLKKWISYQKKQAGGKSILENSRSIDNIREGPTFEVPEATIALPNTVPVDDMSRLVANLRQSSANPTKSTRVEAFDSVQAARDASVQLKTLLRVPVKSPSNRNPNFDASERTQSEFENNLIKTKKAESTTHTNGRVPSLPVEDTSNYDYLRPDSRLPQTPFDQVTGPSSIPQSPHRHISQPQQVSRLPTPPPFPFSPDQVGKKDVKAADRLVIDGPSLNMGLGQQIITHHSQNKQYHNSYSFSSPMHMHSSNQADREAPAPYRRTGDPDFAQTPRYLNDHPPSVPPANKLPLPKLTTHSSALLDLFKSSGAGEPSSATRITGSHASLLGVTDSSGHTHNLATSSTSLHPLYVEPSPPKHQHRNPPSPLPFHPNNQFEEIPRRRSQQQEVLLSLFRNPSETVSEKIQDPPSTLEPPVAPIELSAFPSPSHSRATSQIDQRTTTAHFKPVTDAHMLVIKKAARKMNTTTPPVSATVNGPLNVPQFDRIVRKKSPRSVASSIVKRDESQGQQNTPVTILSRSVTAQKPTTVTKPKVSTQTLPQIERSYRTPVPLPTLKTSEQKTPSKPFQPQILRRPAQVQSTPQDLPTPISPVQSIMHDNLMVGSRPTPAQEHKNTLLDLLSKPSPMISPLTPSHTAFVSPTSEKQIRSESVLPLPRDTPKSRVGSMHSIIGDGSVKQNGGGPIPKQTPVNKNLLLSYLDGVVKEGRK